MQDNNIKSIDNTIENDSQKIRLENWVFFKLPFPTAVPTIEISGMALESELTPDTLNYSCFVARGDVYNSPVFPNGAHIITSLIAEFSDGQIRTSSGTVYHLGKMHPDYTTFVEAAENYPVINDWSIGTATISENPDSPKAVYIKGHPRGSRCCPKLIKLITEQDGHVITCHDGTKYCVDWCAINDMQKFLLDEQASPLEKQYNKITPMFSYDDYPLSYSCNFLSLNWDSYASESYIPFPEAKMLFNL